MNALILPAVLIVLQAASHPVSDDLERDVRTIAAAGSNEARFDAVTALLEARHLDFTVEPFTLDKPAGREPRTEGRNIVVTIGTGAGHVLVGAHYDAARLPDGSLSRGAVDNAASSVLLVRLAERLAREPLPVRVTVVWFDMEELGLIGSARFIEAHGGERPRAMLNFDVNAYGDSVLYGPSGHERNAGLRRALLETCADLLRDCLAFPQMPPGDDRSFEAAGIPALSLATLPAAEAHQVWLMVNSGKESGLAPGFAPGVLRTIHTQADVPDRIDAHSMAQTLEFAAALVRRVAGR